MIPSADVKDEANLRMVMQVAEGRRAGPASARAVVSRCGPRRPSQLGVPGRTAQRLPLDPHGSVPVAPVAAPVEETGSA